MIRMVSVMRKELRHMLRDPWVLITVTLGASVLMTLMAYTFSADVEHVPIVVLDGDRSSRSRAYLERFAHDKFFDLRYWATDYREAREWVRSGQARAAIVVSPGFGESVLRGESVPVQIVVDGVNPDVAEQIMGNAEALSANFSIELLEERLASAGLTTTQAALPFEFRVRALYNPDLKEVNSVLPGLMAIVLSMPALSAALSMAREKEQGSLEGLIATPIRRYQLLAGKVIPYLLLGLVDIFLFSLIGMIVFGVPLRGSWIDLLLSSGLFIMANLGIALLISSLANSQMATLIIAGLIFTLPPINEAGIFHPLYAMPSDARMQSLMWPATHYVIIARGIFLKGVGLKTFTVDALYLLVCGVLLNSIAMWRFRKKLS